MISRLVEAALPARLGRPFRLLLASALVSNIGDGIALAAGPLLVASQTRDPFLVSLAALAQTLSKLVFGVAAGAVADRLDRRRLIATVDLARAVLLTMLAASIAGGSPGIGLVLVVLFVLGAAETFADVAAGSLAPRVVERADLGTANARIQGATLLANQLIVPPIGAALFALGMALPFVVNAICFAAGAVLIVRIAYRPDVVVPGGSEPRAGWLTEIGEGIRWLTAHAAMRTLALTIVAFNVTFGAAWSVLVLYAQERLGMPEVGFGLLTSAIAVGGIVGTLAYGRLERRFSLADIMRVGLLVETGTHLVLAVSTSPPIVLVTFVVFGAHAFVWDTISTAIRQRSVPDALLGRVTGVYHVGIYGGMAAGAPIGGLLAASLGITAPYWFGFAGSALLVVLLWREFGHIAHAEGEAEDSGPPDVSG